MAEAFVANVDNLVTKDYLDVRLDALEARINAQFRLMYWTQGIIVAVVLVPMLRDFVGAA
jgi:hypothetical protein